MEALTQIVGDLNSIVWGVPMLILILGVGLYLTFGLRLLTIIKIPFGFDLLWKGRIPGDYKGISPFNALMTSLAATIDTGNIAGGCNRDLPRRTGRGVLDVDDRPRGHGHQIRRGRSGRTLPRNRRARQAGWWAHVLH